MTAPTDATPMNPPPVAQQIGDVAAVELPRRPPTAVVRAALGLRRRLLALADRAVPPQFALFDHSVAGARAAALAAVTRFGIADLLVGGPRTAVQLAEQVDLDPDALHRLMRSLALAGIFSLGRDGRFGLTPMSERLRIDHPDSMRNWVLYWSTDSNQSAWAAIDETVRTGVPAFPSRHGMSVWQWFTEHPDEGRLFASAMRRITELDAPDIVGLYPWPRTGTVCDLAGGAGTLLSRILQSRPELDGVLVEAPLVLAEAERVLEERGVRDRAELVVGDLFGSLEAEADVYVLKSVLHDWDDDTCRRILATVRATMRPGTTLVLVELLQERNEASYPSSLTDLQMMVVCDGGRERSRVELQALLRASGFTPTSVHEGATGVGLVAATA